VLTNFATRVHCCCFFRLRWRHRVTYLCGCCPVKMEMLAQFDFISWRNPERLPESLFRTC